jgi:polyisoprenoid-binding protein YceI
MPFNKWPAYALAPLILAAAACMHVPAPVAAPPAAASIAGPPAVRPAGAVDYRIDAMHSTVRVLVYRSGTLASIGHNHVILDQALSGWVRAGKTPQECSFYLQLAVADFIVDPPQARAEEGADFSEAVEEPARVGTQRNMLGAALLDGERYPTIQIESLSVQGSGSGPAMTASLRITLAGRTTIISAPFNLDLQPESLHVTADLWLPQTTLGLTPFSALLGGLQVANEMHLKLDLQATSAQPAGLD